MKTISILSVFGCLVGIACGGPTTPTPATPTSTDKATPAASASHAASTPTAVEPEHDLAPGSSRSNPVTLDIEMASDLPKSRFPSAVTDDGTCWKEVELHGNHDKDYAALLSKCGEATGLLPYTKTIESRVHDVSKGNRRDPNDHYAVKLRKGMCYRAFAVGDEAVDDINIVITRADGALVGTDRGKSPAALVQGSGPICIDYDQEWRFEVDVDGHGNGRYKFGVWARWAK